MSAILGVYSKVSSMLTGSFRVCIYMEMRNPRSCLWTCGSSQPPTQKKNNFWQALNYLHTSLPKLLKYVRIWSNRNRFFRAHSQQSFLCGLVGSDMKTQKEQRLPGSVKDTQTTAALQNLFHERHMKHLPSAKTSRTSRLRNLLESVVKTHFI